MKIYKVIRTKNGVSVVDNLIIQKDDKTILVFGQHDMINHVYLDVSSSNVPVDKLVGKIKERYAEIGYEISVEEIL